MSDNDPQSSGSNAGVVILVALLVLAVPCCGGLALVGLGLFSFRAASVPAPAPPQVMTMPAPVDAPLMTESNDLMPAADSVEATTMPAESPPAAITPEADAGQK